MSCWFNHKWETVAQTACIIEVERVLMGSLVGKREIDGRIVINQCKKCGKEDAFMISYDRTIYKPIEVWYAKDYINTKLKNKGEDK